METESVFGKTWRRWSIIFFLLMAGSCSPLVETSSFAATLTVAIGSGQGGVKSTPEGISCPDDCSGNFTDVVLKAAAPGSSLFRGWGGACAGTADCSLSLGAHQDVIANFDPVPPVLHVRSGHGALQAAYHSIQDGGTLLVEAGAQGGGLNPYIYYKTVVVAGGYDSGFTSVTGMTTLHGPLIIERGYLMVSLLRVGPAATAPQFPPAALAVAAGDGRLTVTWDPVPDATSYNLYYSTSAGVTKGNGIKVTGATSGQSIAGLSNGTTYYIVATAVGPKGESMESVQVMNSPAAAIPPPPPGGMKATAGSAEVELTWERVHGAAHYNIYWSTSPGGAGTGGNKILGVVAHSYRHGGLQNGTTYYYAVTASDGALESVASAEVSANPSALTRMSTYEGESLLLKQYVIYEYDAAGRKTRESFYDSAGKRTGYNTYEYYGEGEWTSVKVSYYGGESGDQLVHYAMNKYSMGRLYHITDYIRYGTTFRVDDIYKAYNEMGELVRTYSVIGAVPGVHSERPGSNIWYDYNEAGYLIRTTYYHYLGGGGASETIEYDADGRTIRESNGWKGSKVYELDASRRVIRTSEYDRDGNLMSVAVTSYNADGNVSEISTRDSAGVLMLKVVMEYGN